MTASFPGHGPGYGLPRGNLHRHAHRIDHAMGAILLLPGALVIVRTPGASM